MFLALTLLVIFVALMLLYLGTRYSRSAKTDEKLVNDAQQDISRGDLIGAEEKLRNHLKKDPNSIAASLSLLKVYRERDKPTATLKLCRDLLRKYESGNYEFDPTPIHNEIGHVLWNLRNYEEAFFHFVRCFKVDKNLPGLDKFAYALASQGYYREALELFNEYRQKKPKDMEVIRQMVPCHVGLYRVDEARNCLLDLFANSAARNLDNYFLGKLFYEIGDRESAHNYFIDFLVNLIPSSGGQGQDALAYVMPIFRDHSGNFSSREADTWIRILQNVLSHVHLSQQQKCELSWQLGFLLLLKDPDNLDFEAARGRWSEVAAYQADYKEVNRLTLKLEQENSRGEWLSEFRNLRRQNFKSVFGDMVITNLRASEMFEIPPFRGNTIEEWLNPAAFKGSKHSFKSAGGEFDFRDLEAMPPKQFKSSIQRYLESKKFIIKREIVLDGVGTSLYLLCSSPTGKSCFWVFHRNSGDTGEIELKTVIEQSSMAKADSVNVVSLGSFTSAAVELAAKNNIELMSIRNLQISWN